MKQAVLSARALQHDTEVAKVGVLHVKVNSKDIVNVGKCRTFWEYVFENEACTIACASTIGKECCTGNNLRWSISPVVSCWCSSK